jgi:sigma-B regulation protein RsbU (phosphoserine phosphatase)
MVLFSDGVTEAMDPAEELYGVPRLKDLLNGRLECPLEELQKCVLESVETFTRGASQADDLTLLIVRYRATATNNAGTDTDTNLRANMSSSPTL